MEARGYAVIRCMGHGAQGRVYEVRDRAGRLRVVKQLPWENEMNREDALKEVRLLSSLRHPCIVPYLENFLVRSSPSLPVEDTLCLVMSRCEHDLRQECTRRRREAALVTEPRALSWLAQLAWGLQHLHARKFLHRDLKPQNVLLTQSGRVLLADFGVACHLERSEELRSTRVGTLAFMSPEMLEGKPYGRKTDQWALGCVLFEILVLEPPFTNCPVASLQTSFEDVVSKALATRLPSGYSAELCQTLRVLLACKPEQRPSNSELLSSQMLRAPFHAFVQSLQAAASAASMSLEASGSLVSPVGGNHAPSSPKPMLNAGMTTNMHDFLQTVLPPPRGAPLVGLGGGALGQLVLEEDETVDCSAHPPQQRSPMGTENASYSSDFENYWGESSQSQSCSSDVIPSYDLGGVGSSPDASHDTVGLSGGTELPDPVTSRARPGLGAGEWRQLLSEAEALLHPSPEARVNPEAELRKVRQALVKLLGTEPQVRQALSFLRERQPLGDTVEADELLLQVELLDIVGDEGLHALPLLERCLALEQTVAH